ncbi:hypothetical protein Tco_0153436 [Tanacetum coccineum]
MSTMGITLSFIGLYVMQEMNGNLYQPNKYVAAHILKKFDFVTMKTASTPIETNKALLKDKEAEDVDVHLYRSMIGSLMYLTAFRPDISLVVCACASDYAGASLDRKSTIEVVNFLAKDETIIKEWEDRIDRAAITASSLEVECQDTILGGAEAQTRFKVASKQSNDPPLLRVNTLGSGEDNMKPKELMECCTKLSERALDLTINGERQKQALEDKKKVIITETNIRSDLKLDDAEGTYCLPTATIFAELERMGYENLTQKLTFYKACFSSQWKFLIHTILQCLSAKNTSWNEFSSTMASDIICLATNKNFNFSKYIFDNMVKNLEGGVKFLMYPRFLQVFLDKQVEGMSRHKGIFVIPSHTKKVFANMKRPGKGFSRKVTPLFETMMVQATEDMGEDSAASTDSYSTPINTQQSSSKPQKKKSRRKQRKDNGLTEPNPDEAINEEHVATPSCGPPQSGEDRMQITKLIDLCTQLQSRVLALETTKSNQALEIDSLKEEKIADLDADAEVTLVDETQEMNDNNLMFDTGVLEKQEKEVAEKEVSAADLVTTTGEVVTTANVEVTIANAPTTTIDELTLAQTLIEIKAAKPKAVTSTATTTTTTRLKARGVVVQETSEFKTTSSPLQASQLPHAKDKGKAKMVELEKPLKKKD